MAAETAPIKSLEVQVEAQANSAAKALDLLASKLDVIANKLDGMSGNMKLFASMGGNIVKTANQIDRAAKKMAEANNKKVAPKADTRDMEKMSAVLDEVKKKITLADAVGRKSNLTANLMPQTKQLPAVIQKDIFAGIKETAATTASAIKNVSENTKDLGNSAELLTGRLRRSDGGLTRAGMEAKKASGEFKRASAALQEMGKAPATTAAFSKDMSVRAKQFADMVKKESTEMMTSGEAEKIGKAMAGYKRASTHIDEVIARHRQAKQAAEEHADAEREAGDSAEKAAQSTGADRMRAGWESFLGTVKEVVPVMKRIMSTAWKVGKTIASTGLKMARAFVHPIKSLKQLGAKLKEVLGIGQRSGGLFRGRSFGQFLGLMLLRRAIYAILRSITQGIKEGSDNLTHYSAEYNNSISSLVSSLNYLKNAWAAAFAPIVNAVAPYLSKFIDMIAAAMNAIGRFMAVLTGKGFAVQAVKGWTDVAAASDKAAGSAGKAAKAAEEYKNTIMSFDELHVLNSTNDGSGGSGGGGGGGAGSGTDYSSMFETVAVDTEHGFAAELRKAFESGDFEAIGDIVAQHIADSLNSIVWTDIEDKAKSIANKIATTINGFINNEDVWTATGKAIGGMINTATGVVSTFFNTVKFEKLGKQIMTSVKTAIDTVEPEQIGSAISGVINAGIGLSYGILSEGVNNGTFSALGSKVGTALSDAIRDIKWEELGGSVGYAITALFTFLGDLLQTTDFKALGDGLKIAFRKAISDINWDTIKLTAFYAMNGLLDLLLSVSPTTGEWDDIGEKISKEILDGLLAVFDNNITATIIAKKLDLLILRAVAGLGEAGGALGILPDDLLSFPDLDSATEAEIAELERQLFGNGNTTTTPSGTSETRYQSSGAQARDRRLANQEVTVTATLEAHPADSYKEYFDENGKPKVSDKTVTATGQGKQGDKYTSFYKNGNWAKLSKDKNVTATALGSQGASFINTYTKPSSAWVKLKSKTVTAAGDARETAKYKLLHNEWTHDMVSKTVLATMTAAGQWTFRVNNNGTVSGGSIAWNKFGGILTKAGWQPIQGYANGGLVSGEHFIARENGAPELVGRIGTRTAVMNNDQIVASVSDGVYRAVAAAMGNGGGSMPYQINLTVKTQNDEVLARAVERGNASRNYRANAYGY